MVADPAGTLSCSHSVTTVKRVVPTTLVHEFQHMISYNQHVLIRHGKSEMLWLNEGLSHYAEELGGRTYLPGDSTTYCNYVSGDMQNAYQYLQEPGTYPLVDTAGIGGLANRGAGWLYVRYLVDRFAGDTALASQNGVTRALVQTALRSTNNVSQATGVPFCYQRQRMGTGPLGVGFAGIHRAGGAQVHEVGVPHGVPEAAHAMRQHDSFDLPAHGHGRRGRDGQSDG